MTSGGVEEGEKGEGEVRRTTQRFRKKQSRASFLWPFGAPVAQRLTGMHETGKECIFKSPG